MSQDQADYITESAEALEMLGKGYQDTIENCNHRNKSFIQSSRFSGDHGHGRDAAHICLTCGMIFIFGERNGEWFDITLHITLPEQAVAVKKWVDYVVEAG